MVAKYVFNRLVSVGRGNEQKHTNQHVKRIFYINGKIERVMNNRFVEIRKQIGKFIANFSVTEEDGKEYIFDGDVIREGLEISTYNESGDVIPLPDGEYTIKGTKVIVTDGKVSELPDKESKVEETPTEPKTDLNENPSQETPTENEGVIAELRQEIAEKESEIAELKKQIEELKNTPLANPVPQRTDMSTEQPTDIPDRVKGTKYEKACRIFRS